MWFLQSGLTFSDVVMRIIAVLVITFLVLPFHEFSHAFVAYKLGDDTAKMQGRLTINPLSHFSTFGAVVLLLFDFGWAKPVPLNPRNFKNPRRDMALVALAGPLSYILAAILGGILLNFAPFMAGGVLIAKCILYYISINISLAVFNLLPLPSLDGFRILEAFIPEKFLIKYYKNLNMITWIIIILILVGILDLPMEILRVVLYNLVIKISHIPFM